jgi:hypothetical protein
VVSSQPEFGLKASGNLQLAGSSPHVVVHQVIQPAPDAMGIGIVAVLHEGQVCFVYGLLVLAIGQVSLGKGDVGLGTARIQLDCFLGHRQGLGSVAIFEVCAAQDSRSF